MSSIPKPISNVKNYNPPKEIIPSERLKSSVNSFRFGLGTLNKLPLTRDLTNTRAVLRSPDLQKPINSRMKLRRSKSACDLREVTSFKRIQPTLAPIPSKAARIVKSEERAINIPVKPINNFKPTFTSNFKTKTITTKSNTKSSTSTSRTNISSGGESKGNIKKKIPAYDYKARFLDLQERHKSLKEKFDDAKEKLVHLDHYEECQAELIKVNDELKKSTTQLECLQKQNNFQSNKIDSLSKILQETKESYDNLKKEHDKLSKEHTLTVKELNELNEKASIIIDENKYLTTELSGCKEQLFKSNIERKELHNALLDLRGNIRVFCRVRPPLENEKERLLCGWNYIDEATLEVSSLEPCVGIGGGTGGGGRNKCASHAFNFDYIFHPRSTQDDVFEMVSPLIQSALDGYNICIFAYGQTGSGKTFTMDGIPDNIGVIPRTVDLLFESLRNYKRLGWEYEIKASFLEIYNENLYDLLSNDQKDMEIKMANKNNKNEIYVSNITEIKVEAANHLRELIYISKQNRATACTIGNERSSRSHAVTRIELIGTHQIKNETSIGLINLVDLAGSESPKTSQRMQETKNINRSLSELTNVILALLQKQDYIPYRNSKLTHLLMPCLGGNSKTLMFINVSPFQDCFIETVKSLRFAASVNSCKTAKVRKNKFLNLSSTTTNNSLLSSSSSLTSNNNSTNTT